MFTCPFCLAEEDDGTLADDDENADVGGGSKLENSPCKRKEGVRIEFVKLENKGGRDRRTTHVRNYSAHFLSYKARECRLRRWHINTLFPLIEADGGQLISKEEEEELDARDADVIITVFSTSRPPITTWAELV